VVVVEDIVIQGAEEPADIELHFQEEQKFQ
jgi:hypothetical protein